MKINMIKRCLKNYLKRRELMKRIVKFHSCAKEFDEEDIMLVPAQLREVAESLDDKVMTLKEGYKILRKSARKSTEDIRIISKYNCIQYSRYAGLPSRYYWELLKYERVE